jgi:hypothetical protein
MVEWVRLEYSYELPITSYELGFFLVIRYELRFFHPIKKVQLNLHLYQGISNSTLVTRHYSLVNLL